MSSEIAIALLSGGSSIIVALASIYANNRVIGYKVDNLKEQVEKHNKLIERTAVVERDLKTAFSKIDENRAEIKEVRQLVTK